MGTQARWGIGVAVGKFYPPHLGHVHLLATAAAATETLHVLLCDHPDQRLAARDRASWLADALPEHVVIHITPDDLPPANEPWAARALAVLPERPDVAFTSEAWGPGWAEAMGAAHEMVDLPRAQLPVSGTAVRADLPRHFHHLVPAARANLVRRVVLVGAESTGKSTLAEALAADFRTVWVPEHGRWYAEGRRHLQDQAWASTEFVHIAGAQADLEDALARKAVGGLLIADTDALTTAVWHHRYRGHDDEQLQAVVASRRPHHYLICAPDIPWRQDGTRESRDERDAMHRRTLAAVQAAGVPHTLLEGPHPRRMTRARAVCRAEVEELAASLGPRRT